MNRKRADLIAGERVARAVLTLLLVIVGDSCGSDSVTKSSPKVPARIEAASSLSQSGAAGTVLASPPSVRVLDHSGAPIGSVVVHFTLTSGDAVIAGTAPLTSANGVATLGSWTLGTGQSTVTASVGSLPPVTFTAAGNLATAAHRVGVRVTNGVGEFYDHTGGAVFVPRGSSYIRLARQDDAFGGTIVYHSTFNTGLYDAPRAEAALVLMQASGYNVVDVFLNGCCTGSIGQSAGGLSTTYLANVADFLTRAKAHGIFVILSSDEVPLYEPYVSIVGDYASAQFANYNVHYLTKGGVDGTRLFWHDAVVGLNAQHAPLDAIFSYQVRQELYFDSDHPPFTLTSGSVTTANGSSYDMASAPSKQQMMDDNLIYWTDQVRAEIVALDPTAMVDIGFFVPQSPNSARVGDPRFIQPYPAIAHSTADFVKTSVYQGAGLTLAQYAENFGMESHLEKPVLMGEYGVLQSDYPSTASAASALKAWQIESCTQHFTGWLLWTWDTEASEQVDGPFWSARSGDAAIDHALAPATRPNACAP